MADAFAPVQPGDPLRIPAEAYNAMLAAAKAHRDQAWQVVGHPRPSTSGNVLVLVLNIDNLTIPRYGAIGIQAVHRLANDEMLINGKPPEAPHVGRWLIATEPIKPGTVGRAVAAGVTLAVVEVRDVVHRAVDVVKIGSEWKLATCVHGYARLWWVSGTSGSQLALIAFPVTPPIGVRYGRLQSVLDTNDLEDSATMYVYANEEVVDILTVYPSRACKLGVILPNMHILAAYERDTDRYVAIHGGKARRIEFAVDSTFDESDTTFTARFLYGVEGDDPVSPNQLLTIENSGNLFRGSYPAHGFAYYDPETDKYRAYQIECEEDV